MSRTTDPHRRHSHSAHRARSTGASALPRFARGERTSPVRRRVMRGERRVTKRHADEDAAIVRPSAPRARRAGSKSQRAAVQTIAESCGSSARRLWAPAPNRSRAATSRRARAAGAAESLGPPSIRPWPLASDLTSHPLNEHSFMPRRRRPARRAPPHRGRADRQARRDPARRDRHLRRARLLQRPGRRRRPRRRRRRRHGLPLLPQQGRPARLDLRAHHEARRSPTAGPRRRRSPIRSSGSARSPGCTSTASGRDRDLAVVFQVELRQSTKFMERFSSTLLRDYLGIIRDAIADGQARGRVPRATSTRRSPPRCSSARSTRWPPTGSSAAAATRSRPRPTPSSTCSSNGARRAAMSARMSADPHRPPCSAPARWARRSPRTSPTPACPSLLLDVTRDAAREGLERARSAQARPVLHARRRGARHAPAASTTTSTRSRTPTGSSKRSSSGSTSSRRCSSASTRVRRAGIDRQLEHVGHSDRRARRRPLATTSGGTGSARTSSTRRATCGCSS